MLLIGENNITNIFLGDEEITGIYIGDDLVYTKYRDFVTFTSQESNSTL